MIAAGGCAGGLFSTPPFASGSSGVRPFRNKKLQAPMLPSTAWADSATTWPPSMWWWPLEWRSRSSSWSSHSPRRSGRP